MEHKSVGRGAQSFDEGDPRLVEHTSDIRHRLQAALSLIEEIAGPPADQPKDWPETQRRVREILMLRRRRSKYFDSDLFADPAWDILLELFAAQLGQVRISVSSLCIGAAVPATTALRWIKLLEKRGMIDRTADPVDGRRIYMSLSPETFAAMEHYFAGVPPTAEIV